MVPNIGRLRGGNDLCRGPQRQGPYKEKTNNQGCYRQPGGSEVLRFFGFDMFKREHATETNCKTKQY